VPRWAAVGLSALVAGGALFAHLQLGPEHPVYNLWVLASFDHPDD
jgi:hypothetical protein